jgi:hypothetical protein
MSNDTRGPLETRRADIKTRRLEIAATLAAWKRDYFVEGIERPMRERATLEAEAAALALEERRIGAAAIAEQVARRGAALASAPRVPQGYVMLPSPITEDMHVAASKVLVRANGLDGTPQRMLDAMTAAAPQPEGGA